MAETELGWFLANFLGASKGPPPIIAGYRFTEVVLHSRFTFDIPIVGFGPTIE
jgi:hypothetical protein